MGESEKRFAVNIARDFRENFYSLPAKGKCQNILKIWAHPSIYFFKFCPKRENSSVSNLIEWAKISFHFPEIDVF